MLFIHGADALELSIYDSIFAFINPGSSFVNITEGAGKIWAIIIGICGMILLGGFLISIFSNILARRVEKVRYGQVYYDFENHVVIIGYDSMVIDLVMQHPSVEIVLQTLRKAPEVRHELFSKLTSGIEKNVTIVSGNRDATEDLEKLCIHKAKVLYILGEKGEQDRDSINIESLKKINKILLNTQAGANKPCFVLIENQSTYAVLQQQDVNGLRVERTMKNGMKETLSYPAFHPFNIPELWAQKLFADCKYEHKENEKESENYLPLDRTGICYDSDNTVHLVILGMSKMGVALGIQASHLCHFPNFIRDNRLKTRITFVDENADREMYFLKGRYRYLFHETDCAYEDTEQPEKSHDNKQRPKFTDIEWRFVKGRVERPEVRERLTAYSNEKHTLLTVAVCFGSPAAAIACGLYLPDEIYQSGAQILVRQDTHHSILSMLGSTGKYGNVKPFGMTDLCPDLSRNSDRLPMIVNYVYDYYYHHLEIPDSVPPMVEMEKLWEKLKTAKKWSNRYNANMLAVKQRAFGLCPGEPPEDRTVELLAEVEHNRWNIEELLLGYRPTTPEEKKEIGSNYTWKEKMKKDFVHNDICPYHAIPDMDTEPEKANGNKIKNTRSYDICLSKAIPMILEYIGKE
ncbi:MAG: hypothetical protein LBP64_05795 [Tannerella sp.]|nr:hypothetical protein [Tannerella sp.]